MLAKDSNVCSQTVSNVSFVVPEVQSRIVGGQPTSIQNAPYVIQLLHNGKFICGGTLIAPRVVVTAAHCVKGFRPGNLSIKAKATKLSQPGVISRVWKVITPKGFNMNTKTLDVAVLKLRSPVNGIRRIGLCNRVLKDGDNVQVYGWGLRRENAMTVSNHLQTVKVRAIAKSKCEQLYRGKNVLTRTMFCASIPGRKDACSGDSGGPAIVNGQFCGIVSWGVGCARKNYPGVYTNVFAVRNFIRKAMKRC
ncbi:trypsin beta-like [Cochliomyia hominivorax]